MQVRIGCIWPTYCYAICGTAQLARHSGTYSSSHYLWTTLLSVMTTGQTDLDQLEFGPRRRRRAALLCRVYCASQMEQLAGWPGSILRQADWTTVRPLGSRSTRPSDVLDSELTFKLCAFAEQIWRHRQGLNYRLAESYANVPSSHRVSIGVAEHHINNILLIFGLREPCSRLNMYCHKLN
jgi:hypothetical protein